MFGLFKKKKREPLDFRREIFEHIIVRMTESFVSKRDTSKIFEDLYEKVYFEEFLDDDSIGDLWDQVTELKDRYIKTLRDLMAISDNNSLFFTSREQMQAIDILEREKKISADMLKTLPYLIEYTDIYNILAGDLYQKLDNVTDKYEYVWQGFDRTDQQCSGDDWVAERCRASRDSCIKCSNDAYIAFVIADCWELIQENYPQHSTPADYDYLVRLALDNPTVMSAWRSLWYKKFKALDAEVYHYGSCWRHLYEFFNDTHKDLGNPAWLDHPIESIGFGFESSFPLFKPKDYTKEELTRIYNLYLDGTLSGKYRKENDPKYSEDIQ